MVRKRVDVAADIDAFTVDFDGLVPGTLRHGDSAGHDAGGHACGQANPRSGKVYEGIDLVRRTGADFLLALGGGSVIDTAKAIGFGALYKGDFWDFFTGAAKIEKTLPVGVVLTISAAGSEGSDSCVITQERGNLKWGCPKTDVIRPTF